MGTKLDRSKRTILKGLSLTEVSLCPVGEDKGADVLIFKMADDDVAKAEWSTAFVNNLPDSSFAYIAPGGSKDSEGKTTPRNLRSLPYKDGSGKVDPAHLRNALARLPQTKIPAAAKAKALGKLRAAAKGAGVEVSKSMDDQLEMPKTFGALQAERDAWSKWCTAKYDFTDSVQSILNSAPAGQRVALLKQSLAEFESQVSEILSAIPEPVAKAWGELEEAETETDFLAAAFNAGALDEQITAAIAKVGRKEEDPMAFDRKTLSPEAAAAFEALEKAAKTAEDEKTKAMAAKKAAEDKMAAMQKAASPPSPEDVLKDASPEVRAIVAKMQADSEQAKADAAAAKEAVAKAAAEKRRSEVIAKAGRDYANLGAEHTDAIADVMLALPEAEATKLGTVLKAADALVKESAAFSRAGTNARIVGGSADAQLESRAKEIAKAEGITVQKAYDKACQENPELARRAVAGEA